MGVLCFPFKQDKAQTFTIDQTDDLMGSFTIVMPNIHQFQFYDDKNRMHSILHGICQFHHKLLFVPIPTPCLNFYSSE